MNHVIGPLSRGQGRKSLGKDLTPVLNYGGPSSFVLQKYVPGNMPISGISKHLLLSVLRLLDLSEVMTTKPTCQLFSVSLQMDGTMVKAGLSWDDKLGFAVGCQDPLTYQDMEEKNFKLPGDFLKKQLVTEVDVCLLSSLCSNVTLSLGYILQPNSGKTGRDIVEKYTQIIKTVSKCEACVMVKPAQFNTIPPETTCNSFCEECWTSGKVCVQCWSKGRHSIYPQLESCFQCMEKGIKCKKVVVHILALDCFTGNRFLMEKFHEELLSGKKDPEVFLTEPIAEIIHLLKTIKSSFSNWYLLGLDGQISNLSMLRTLRDDNQNKEITHNLRKVLQKGSVVNRDRQDTDCLIEFSKSVPVLREIAISDPVVVHTVCPEKFKMEPTNKMGDIGPIRFLGPINVGKIAVISEDKKDKNKSVLFVLELHSPVKIKDSLELPLVVGFAASEAMIVLLTETGLMVIETVKGTIIPKIPTKKTDLVALCKDLDLNFEGTVKLLKSRLIKKLKPTPKLDPRSIEASPALAKHLHRHSKISEFKVEEGIIKALILADNDAKKLISIELKVVKLSLK